LRNDRSIDLPRFASRALPEHHGDLHILIGASGAICGLANIAPDSMQRAVNGIGEPQVAAVVEVPSP
jgi:hypothetical protein